MTGLSLPPSAAGNSFTPADIDTTTYDGLDLRNGTPIPSLIPKDKSALGKTILQVALIGSQPKTLYENSKVMKLGTPWSGPIVGSETFDFSAHITSFPVVRESLALPSALNILTASMDPEYLVGGTAIFVFASINIAGLISDGDASAPKFYPTVQFEFTFFDGSSFGNIIQTTGTKTATLTVFGGTAIDILGDGAFAGDFTITADDW